MTLQEKQEGFLLDALEYYCQDPEKRRCTGKHDCFYAPITLDTQGCMIGRKLPLELAKRLDGLKESDLGTGILNNDVFNLLPNSLKELDQEFLYQCQQLHDMNYYWNNKGLTDSGKYKIEIIIRQFKLNESKFEKYL